MRPTGQLHLGHYHGVLKNWVTLQEAYDCYFFVADWHALTTHYDDPSVIPNSIWDMVIDWLAAGVDSDSATLFVQSLVPEHAELHLLLSMITPLGWLERVPSYKDQQEKLKEKDLATYGFLGYPLLQSADILIYRAAQVPVGEDQVAHVELTREVARRFNHIYGRGANYEEEAEAARKKMGKKAAKQYAQLRKAYQEQGDAEALLKGQELLGAQQNISMEERERLLGYLEGSGRVILAEPQPLLTKASKMPGLDGQKMSKSYANTISLRETPEQVENKLKRMPTDTNRVRRTDPGDPQKCPVWQFHEVYSDLKTREWVQAGCTSAGIGCLECKAPVIEAVLDELKPIQARAAELEAQPEQVKRIIEAGSEKARAVARETMREVREAMSLQILG
ncbi:MAG: tryptophan--tRNA ligase [Candidatus Thiodiazotropha lotti]|uniref:Tryptophan--tRNA ligase n=2 Tax=Candidatus Thiodiazotropha endoloripes TaxID=1818881 RepID=A0A1E2UVJ9_9GAMM|nr:tryptophan--tRNA ligase [Candidatus Thiodiazotropha weberae]MCG7990417.1 tryptophan--tRNA ligase [Candidatus Thiodiazotropha lotti]ODB85965.1 tryptophan--tRNA ligase [Candidatus Thiodiazotropha endoloripes]MCG7904254.1 tryptophan--tRNA ligase [Candidatus Thiodiazotropha weberae]MCG7913513.1 tryptophan--tRNA ligase [Candidatus Thiodiazotropha weberae]